MVHVVQFWKCNFSLNQYIFFLFSGIKHNVISFKRASGRFSFHFREGFSKMYRIYMKILNSDQGDFQILVESGMF